MGGAIFLAVVTAVVTANSSEGSSPQAVLDSYRPGLIVVTGIALAGLLITLPGLRTRRTQQSVVVAKSLQENQENQENQEEETAAERVAVRD